MKQSLAVGSTATDPGSLLSQYKLLRAVIDAPWATRLDMMITSHVIDRYWSKHGNARVSLRYLQQATAATRPNIIASLRRIVDQGVLSIIRQGVGTRPTEYGLELDFAKNNKPLAKNKKLNGHSDSGFVDNTASASRGSPDDTSNDGSRGTAGDTTTSGIVGDTPRGIADDTSSASSGIADDTESYLRNPLTSGLTVSRNEDTPAVPAAPPVSGLEADPAASAVDPGSFEELWAAFPRKHHRAKAQAAYRALAPSSALHTDLVAKATAWASHYEQTGTERKWWKHLHVWLAEERYLEDLPEPYENPKEAAIARKRENGPRKAGKPNEIGKSGLSPKTPIGRHLVKIVASEITGSSFSEERPLILAYRIEEGIHEGIEFSHAFKLLSADEDAQSEGQEFYAQVRHATGILEPEDTSDFHGKTLLATVKAMGRIEYAAL
ncbi:MULTISPECIES: hypothetical protein [unclassified Bradyrhizobium]|uniref:hypothetical protein n=1 Tax=unclassified Bradyrhizobium TaxID=2631580 RepID=UPI001BA9EE23|nr:MULTISPECIES: hypothetical protein [unclassified Bradyrhizobium]MBR1204488.1 hypothetical protein [Bradyrhizobium sp. AUGA SZCCT0124]MBR1309626.1 hypothetical protein [Bradyrhizobium sp. AUGA SZCCT0051]MBR1339767.1 hypothetical protein [Bradyrhizobium sp. AUGA SZCCT0105]MBR1354374.1 hypothetical protein [Bradyrhizobium sp. AUGA SZCCT0045]